VREAGDDRKQIELATSTAVGLCTVVDFERHRRVVSPGGRAAIQAALEPAAVIFLEENGEGLGVRLRKGSV
jgi:hypothetical protein